MKVTLFPAITLDGFIANNEGICYDWIDEADDAEYEAAMRRYGADIVGRKTYEQYQDSYDKRTDVTTFIWTNQAGFTDTEYLKFVQGTPQQILDTITQSGFTEAILTGGGEVNGQFAEASCIDEIIISIYPLTLGAGIPLFGSYHPKLKLELLETSAASRGITTNRYKVVK